MSKIYLISPEKIELQQFSKSLCNALETGLVPAFQLRLKNYSNQEILKISHEIKKICQDNNTLFILNDSYKLALEAGAGGVHLGDEDDKILEARKNSPQNFIIGASCYDSRDIATNAAEAGADYISFGAFFETKTKISKGKPSPEIISWCNEIINLPTVAIGGINNENCKILVKEKVDFLAVISFVWQHQQGPAAAIKKLNEGINQT